MLGRGASQVDDEPGWREKLADWRDSPPIVFRRPDWLSESPATLALLALGIAFVIMTVVYVAIPPETIPNAIPGHWQLSAKAAELATSTTTTTTTTTVPTAQKMKLYTSLAKLSAADQRKFWAFVGAVGDQVTQNNAIEAVATSPPTPPLRRWDLAMCSFALAALIFAGAWFTSDLRARFIWRT